MVNDNVKDFTQHGHINTDSGLIKFTASEDSTMYHINSATALSSSTWWWGSQSTQDQHYNN